MKHYFCTLVTRGYLFKGLALYLSLVEHCPSFELWILCMDSDVYDILAKMKLKQVKLIALKEIEDEQLLKVKAGRTLREYCWTCYASVPLFILKNNPKIPLVTHIDADTFFYSSPKPVLDELGEGSILLVPQNTYDKAKYLEKITGKFNVGLYIVKNNETGIKFLQWWKDQCVACCFAKLDQGIYGNQLPLDKATKIFPGIRVLENKGANVGPWNACRYKIEKSKQGKITIDGDTIISYHFSSLQIFTDLKFLLFDSFWEVPQEAVKLIYPPYLKALAQSIKEIRKYDKDFDWGLDPIQKPVTIIKTGQVLSNFREVTKTLPFIHDYYSRLKKLVFSMRKFKNIKMKNVEIIDIGRKSIKNQQDLINHIERVMKFQIQTTRTISGFSNSSDKKIQAASLNSCSIISCLKGSCILSVDNGSLKQEILLDNRKETVVVGPIIWFSINNVSKDCQISIMTNKKKKNDCLIKDYEVFRSYIS